MCLKWYHFTFHVWSTHVSAYCTKHRCWTRMIVNKWFIDLFHVIQHNSCLLDPCHSYWLIKTWYFSTQSVFRKLSWNKTNAAPRLCSLEFRPLTSRSDFNELSTKPTNFPCNFLHQLSLHCQRSHFRVSYQIKAPPLESLQLLDPKLLPNIRLRPSSCQIVTYKGMKRKTVSQNRSTSSGVGEGGSVWGVNYHCLLVIREKT